MLDNLTTTQTIGALIGLYFLSAGVGLLIDRNNISGIFKELAAQPMLAYIGGILAFAIGGAIVSVHNVWDDFLSALVSAIGWISLAEGVLMLAFRKSFLSFFERLSLNSGFITVIGAGTAIAGVALLYACLVG